MVKFLILTDLDVDLFSEDAFRENEAENGAQFAYLAYTPTTPHPRTMLPPLPPGEPPALLRNKRPYGLSDVDKCEIPELITDLLTDASTNKDEEITDGASSTGECSNRLEVDDEPALLPPTPIAIRTEPVTPPGPPPAEMAPPPPVGPPPSLPLGRGELKRAQMDDSPSFSPRKRFRAGAIESEQNNVEQSYLRAPVSARLIWDHALRQRASADGTDSAVLEFRTLQALGNLNFGFEREGHPQIGKSRR